MNLASTPKPLMLTPRDEDILQAIAYYRYVTSLDIAHLLFRPTYMPYVRSFSRGLPEIRIYSPTSTSTASGCPPRRAIESGFLP